MTVAEFKKIKWRMTSHLNLGEQHISIYESVDFTPQITMSVCAEMPNCDIVGRKFMIKGDSMVYETRCKVVNAITRHYKSIKDKVK